MKMKTSQEIAVRRLAPVHPPLAHPNLASGLNKISAIAVGLEIGQLTMTL